MPSWKDAPIVGNAGWRDAPIVKSASWKDAPLDEPKEPEAPPVATASMDNLPPRLSRWSAQIIAAANETVPKGVDSNKWGSVIAAVIDRETAGQNVPVHADGHGHGLMGIDDRYHDFARTADVHDPGKNVKYGAAFLRDLFEKTPEDLPFEERLQRAAASYNAGPSHLKSANPDAGTTGGNYGSDVLDKSDELEINIDKALSAPLLSAEDANRAIELGRIYDVSTMTPDEVKTFARQRIQREFAEKLATLPRIASFAAESDAHTSVMQSKNEVDNYGVVEELTKYAFGDTFNLGGTVNDGVMEGGKTHYIPPEWASSIGRAMSEFTDFAKLTMAKNWGLGIKSTSLGMAYIGRVEKPTDEEIAKANTQVKLPHDGKGALGVVNSMAGMVPLIGAALVNPAASFGYMYLENNGRAYAGMRQAGYTHEKAAMASELIGFSTAIVGAAIGPMFKFAPLTIPTRALLGQTPEILSIAIAKSPTVSRLVGDYGINFAANMAMSAAQIAAESSIREAYDSSRAGRRYNPTKVLSDSLGVYHNWAEMAALSIEPAYKAHQERRLLYPKQESINADLSEQQKAAMKIVDNWEERGRGVLSLKEGFKLSTMAQQVQQSDFAKTNPQDAKALLRHILMPGSAERSVYIETKYLEKLDPDALSGLGNPDLSVGETGEKVRVSLLDFLLHPQAEEMLKHVAPGEHLLTIGEAQKFEMPETGVPEMDQTGKVPKVSESAPALDAWAWDTVSRMPSSALEGHAKLHGEAAEMRGREAMQAEQQATAQAEAGKDNTDSKTKAQEALSRQKRSMALNKAATAALEQVKEITDTLQRLGSDTPSEQTGKTPREVVWRAGEDYGQAYDAIMESLGFAPKRGYAAPDLFDVMHRLASEQKLTADQFNGWDLDLVDDLLKTVRPPSDLSLNELREVRKAISQVTLGADSENTVRSFGVRVAKEMISEQLAEHWTNIENVSEGRQINGTKEAALDKIDRMKARAAKAAEVLIEPFTTFEKMGKIGLDFWFEGFVPAESRHERMWREREGKIREVMEKLPKEIRSTGQDQVKAPNGDTWQRHEVWDAMLKVGAVGADRKIARGMGFGDDRKGQRGAPPLSAEEKVHAWIHTNLAADPAHVHPIMEMIQEHWKMFEGIQDEYPRHFKERGLAPPEMVKPQKIYIGGKEYSGGYGGRLRWQDLNQRVLDHPGSLEALMRGAANGPTIDSRQLMERTGFYGRPDFSFNNVHEAMRKEIHDIAFRPFVEDMLKVFSDPQLRQQMANKMGKEAVNAIYDPQKEDSFLHAVARGGVEHNEDAITRMVLKANGLAAYTAFAGNIRVMAGQLSHILASAPALGLSPDHIAMGVKAAFSSEGRANATARFETVRLRYSDYESRSRELNKELTGFEQWNNPVSKTIDHMSWAAYREMDHFISTTVAEAAYAKATEKWRSGKGMDYDAAVREANIAVTKMMPPLSAYEKAPFTRNKSMAGFLFLVRNFPLKLLNVTAMNWWDAKVATAPGSPQRMDKAFDVAVKYVGMSLAIGVIGEGYLMQGGPGQKDDDLARWHLEHQMAGMFYPTMLRAPAMATYQAVVQGDLREAANEMSHLTPAAVSMWASAIINIGTAIHSNDDEKAYKASAKLLGVGFRSPLPVKAYDVTNAIRNGEDPLDRFRKGMGFRE